jgi:glutaryl-CoA dehydrogenase
MQTEITLGLQGCLRLGRMKDEGHGVPEITSHPQAQQLRQGAGHRPHGARHDGRQRHQRRVRRGIRHLVNLEVVNTYEGTHDVHALILGRAITGPATFSLFPVSGAASAGHACGRCCRPASSACRWARSCFII